MSQGFHQGIFNFANGFNRSAERIQEEDQQMQPHRPLAMEEVDSGELPAVYESGGLTMLSEMFNFPSAGTAPPAVVMENNITENYRLQQRPSTATEWYGTRHGMVEGLGSLVEAKQHNNSNNQDNTATIAHHHQHHISSLNNPNSATAMQLFLMNPQPRSPSPTSTTTPRSPPLHFLLPSQSTPVPPLHGYPQEENFGGTPIPQTQFTWLPGSTGGENTGNQQLYGNHRTGAAVEGQVQVQGQGQGLSLSLSSLQHLEAVKAEEMRMGEGGMVYYNQGSSSSSAFHMKNLGSQYQQPLHLQGMSQNPNHQIHVGYSSSFGVINLLRNSRFTKPAQELLEEFCSVGRGHIKNHMKIGRHNKNPNNTNQGGGSSRGGESSSTKEAPSLSATDKIEYQRKKASLLSMLDEVDRRYNNYCEQMQMVVNSYDSVMGHGAASPYTVLAQKAMSRHFRCLKDAIVGQLKTISELVGDKDGIGSTGITKGETPRLKLLDQSLRQQRAFQQMGIMEQEAWRPQRGLPERSVTILRAWLFEHFLHPYPSDADKHLLARQTGLSRNQVSNWFINARVRLWKPMVEEMYQQESKDNEEVVEENNCAQTPMPSSAAAATTQPTSTTIPSRRSQIDVFENDPSLNAINRQCFSESQAIITTTTATTTTPYNDASPTMLLHRYHQAGDDDMRRRGGNVVDYGTTSATGDVSLTLGLQHAGNLPENSQFSVSDYGSC